MAMLDQVPFLLDNWETILGCLERLVIFSPTCLSSVGLFRESLWKLEVKTRYCILHDQDFFISVTCLDILFTLPPKDFHLYLNYDSLGFCVASHRTSLLIPGSRTRWEVAGLAYKIIIGNQNCKRQCTPDLSFSSRVIKIQNKVHANADICKYAY